MSDEIVFQDEDSFVHWPSKLVVLCGEIDASVRAAVCQAFACRTSVFAPFAPFASIVHDEFDAASHQNALNSPDSSGDPTAKNDGSDQSFAHCEAGAHLFLVSSEWAYAQDEALARLHTHAPVVCLAPRTEHALWFPCEDSSPGAVIALCKRVLFAAHAEIAVGVSMQLSQEAVVSIDGSFALRFLNPQAARLICGLPEESLLGRSLRGLLSLPRDFDPFTAHEDTCAEFDASCLDGSGRVLHLRRLGPSRGGLMSYLLIDVTARLKLLEELETERAFSIQAAKMSSLGEVAAKIAHEVANPVQAIVGRGRQIAEEIMRPVPDIESMKVLLDKQMKAAERISSIVKTLGRHSRAAASDNATRVHIADVVEAVRDLLVFKVDAKRVSVRLPPRDQLEHVVFARENELVQVLVNLLSNGVDAVDGRDGAVVSLDAARQGDTLLLRVSDSGPGVPREIEEMIWRPFFTTKESGKGTGLGLAISRTIVERLGGSLNIERTDHGTRFVVALPCSTQKGA